MSHVEDDFSQQMAYMGWTPEREYRFKPPRRYRADFAFPERKLLVEIEGGVYSNGRHVRGKGYSQDCEKYNLAVIDGWDVLRFTSEMVDDGSALTTLENYFISRESGE